jgi:membrane-associated phospholipid phosphatase
VVLVTAGYFAYIAAVALLARVPVRRKVVALGVALAALATAALAGLPHVMPLVFLLAGYWLPSLLVRAPNLRLERRLLEADRSLFGADGLVRFNRQAPRWLVEYLELAYLLCYAVVPAGYLWLILAGFRAESDRFWASVLMAGFLCYGLLPWLPTRAPRAVEGDRAPRRSAVRRLNLAVLDRASVGWNTFPSGHTAASIATALAVGSVVPSAGVVLGVVAASIAAGSVAGRYHYAADAITGALAAVLAFAMATAAHAP